MSRIVNATRGFRVALRYQVDYDRGTRKRSPSRVFGDPQLRLLDGYEGAAHMSIPLRVHVPARPQDAPIRTNPISQDLADLLAPRHLTILDDGLVTPWEGVVWCNPPYSKATPWADKWAAHPDGMILLPALPEVHWRGVVMGAADSFALLAVDFHRPDGTSARLRWPNIIAARGSCADAVARIAAVDKFAHGAYLVKDKGAA